MNPAANNNEINELGNMLMATSKDDAARLLAIAQRITRLTLPPDEPPVECPWPVRDCEPGYRWVRPGEKLESGDQFSSVPSGRWITVDWVNSNNIVQNEKAGVGMEYGYYRRKVTPKPDTGDIAALLDCQPEHARAVVSDMKRVLDELMLDTGKSSALMIRDEVRRLKDQLLGKTLESESRWNSYMELRKFAGLETGDHIEVANLRRKELLADRDAWAETAAEHIRTIKCLEKSVKYKDDVIQALETKILRDTVSLNTSHFPEEVAFGSGPADEIRAQLSMFASGLREQRWQLKEATLQAEIKQLQCLRRLKPDELPREFISITYDTDPFFCVLKQSEAWVRISDIKALRFHEGQGPYIRTGQSTGEQKITPESAERVKQALNLKP